MPLAQRLRSTLHILRGTPLHPQWFVLKDQQVHRRAAASALHGIVLDIGCAGRELQQALPPSTHYIGLDYPATADAEYGTRPDVYGDGQRLPFGDARIDAVALLDVLEHLPRPGAALREMARVLKPGGTLVLQVPFLYPLHDEPRDYTRLTAHGLRQMLDAAGFEVQELHVQGHPLETAALLANIALVKTVLSVAGDGPRGWLVLPLLLALALPGVPLINAGAWLLARLTPADAMMPLGYQAHCTRRVPSHG